jgi:hypothetical protein
MLAGAEGGDLNPPGAIEASRAANARAIHPKSRERISRMSRKNSSADCTDFADEEVLSE